MCTEEDLELPQGGLRGTSTRSFAPSGGEYGTGEVAGER